ncbi:MAG: autotransporter assembly complex family protein, partial [Kofleriaceae bacterium]
MHDRTWRTCTVVTIAAIAAFAISCAGTRSNLVARSGSIRIGEISVTGAPSIDHSDLIDGLSLTHARDEGRSFERYLVAMDRRRVRGYLARHGFFEADVEVDVERRRGISDVRFVIDEGTRARLARVEVVGIPPEAPITAGQLRALIPLELGAPYDHQAIELAIPELTAALADTGYAHARIEQTVFADRASDRAVVRIQIDPGPLARFGEITVTGVDGDLATAVRSRLRVEEGARYSSSAIEASREALYEMGRFSMVRFKRDREARDAVVSLAIELATAKRHELRLGGGIGVDPTSFELRGRAGYTIAGWPRPLYTSRAEVRPAIARLRDQSQTDPRIEARAGIERLDLFRTRMRGELEGGFDYIAIEAYTSVGPRVRAGIRTPLFGRSVHIAGGWQLQAVEFRDLHPALDPRLIADLGLTGTSTLGFFEQSLIVDLRDDPIAPRVGGYGELHVEEGTPAAGGELTYARLVPDVRGYVPIGPVTAAARARFGTIIGEVPVTRRFFGGGANSQRGFPGRRLAPFSRRIVDGEQQTVTYGGA